MPKIKKVKKRQKAHVPYIRGFRPPSKQARVKAMGNQRVKELEPGLSFQPLPKCTSENDWLAQYCEEGQSFNEFKQQCPWISKRKCKGINQRFISTGKNLPEKYPDGVIYLLPLGDFDSKSSPDFDLLREYAGLFFGLPVRTLPKMDLEFSNNAVYCVENEDDNGGMNKVLITSRWHQERYQLNIVSLLRFMHSIAPEDALCTIALTMSDLYEAKSDLFVAGMAAGNHRVGVFSFCRYDPGIQFSEEFWYQIEPKGKLSQVKKQRLLVERSCRLLVHEIAHILGVGHCIYYACCMNGSGHLGEDFKQPMFLCPVDLHKLAHLCGFDIVERYKQLQGFFHRFGLQDQVEWIRKRLEFIQGEEDTSICES